MKNKIYTWNTVPHEKIELEKTFGYNNEVHKDLSGWVPGLNTLEITLKITPNDVDIHNYLKTKEHAYWMIVWTTDKKFTGTSKLLKYKNESQNISCSIPEFFTDTRLDLKLFLVARSEIEFKNPRLDGSVLFETDIYKTEKTGTGAFFPLKEVGGDGKNLILFDFRKPDDFNMPLTDVLDVTIDLNHKLAKEFHSNKETRSFIFLLIIQNYYQIALSNDVFEVICAIEKFEIGSIGYSFIQILKVLGKEFNYTEIKDLKEYFDRNPHRVNEKIIQKFAQLLK